MGIEERIKREQFLQELKNPTPKMDGSAQDILEKITARKQGATTSKSPYDCGGNSLAADQWRKLRKMAGI